MPTRQDMANFIKTIPKAYEAIGVDLDKWVNGEIYGVEDRWFSIFQIEGGDQHLANIICCFLNIPSVGYDDFSNAKQKMADAYRSYVAHAQAEVDAQEGIVEDLQNQLNAATDDAQKSMLSTEITVESSRLSNAQGNLSTWNNTLKTYLDATPEAK